MAATIHNLTSFSLTYDQMVILKFASIKFQNC